MRLGRPDMRRRVNACALELARGLECQRLVVRPPLPLVRLAQPARVAAMSRMLSANRR